MNYGLYPFTWDAQEQCHRPPDGAMCCIDLRPASEQAKQGQSAGYGFFSWNGSGPPPSDLISLGTGDCREIQPTDAQRLDIKTKLGLSATPSGTFLVDCMADVLGPLSDPTGASGPSPIMPTVQGTLDLHLESHSRVWTSSYTPAATLAAVPTGRANRVRDVFRRILDQALIDGGSVLVAKMLGEILLRHGCQRSEVAQGATAKRAEWVRLLTPATAAKLGGQFKPQPPATTYTVNFDDNSLSGWTELNTTGTYTASSGAAQYSNTASQTVLRYDSDVSSTNHYATQTTTARSQGLTGSCVRKDSSSTMTFYAHRVASTTWLLLKWIAGTQTVLSNSGSGTTAPQTTSTQANGSTISIPEKSVSVTDTSITTGTRGGLFAHPNSAGGSTATQDDFTFADITSGATAGSLLLCGVGT